eukprot:3507857-Ditylum_brightwellii.AAC.1
MEKEKKAKYLKACLEHRRHFTSLIYSADGMHGEEATAAEKCITSHLHRNWTGSTQKCVAMSKPGWQSLLCRATPCSSEEQGKEAIIFGSRLPLRTVQKWTWRGHGK